MTPTVSRRRHAKGVDDVYLAEPKHNLHSNVGPSFKPWA